MLVGGRPLEEIVEYSGLTKEEVESMKTSPTMKTYVGQRRSEVMKTSPSHEDLCKSRPLQVMKTSVDFFSSQVVFN